MFTRGAAMRAAALGLLFLLLGCGGNSPLQPTDLVGHYQLLKVGPGFVPVLRQHDEIAMQVEFMSGTLTLDAGGGYRLRLVFRVFGAVDGPLGVPQASEE